MSFAATLSRAPWPIVAALVLHLAVAAICVVALVVRAPLLLGVHPAVKPLKFAISISLFLASMAWIIAVVDASKGTKLALATTFAVTMVVEMAAILIQALRGVPSHFNTRTPVDAAMWNAMFIAIVVAVVGMIAITLLATVRRLDCDSVLALAYRLGLWILLLTAVSGFAMGGRHTHTVSGTDGGEGLPVTNWSTRHGDLRVSHFWSLHALQALPVLAWILHALIPDERVSRAVVVAVALLWGALTIFTLVQAFAGRPFLPSNS